MPSLPRDPARGPLRTPDGRYIVVRGRLWRTADPALPAEERERLVVELMSARRAVHLADADPEAVAAARARVDAAKHALGERGPPWWNDGAPDENRRPVRASSYADWYASLDAAGPTDAPADPVDAPPRAGLAPARVDGAPARDEAGPARDPARPAERPEAAPRTGTRRAWPWRRAERHAPR
ncbi:MAG TPA: hypothetical protein VEA81_11750 [Burkholderiaceae bacterium]|nr:hypothetical protein [Burkholderiaceae bacterium]